LAQLVENIWEELNKLIASLARVNLNKPPAYSSL
jgi:hypothetical protein